MASTDAKPFPIKNVAYRVTFPIFDATGALVTGATSLDSEVSKDAANPSDCTNEAVEITGSGVYYLDLTSTEMNADTVAVIVKSSNGKTTPLIIYPIEATDTNIFADDLLKRDLSAVTGEASRSPINAFRFLRNKWTISGTTLTVTKENDTTTAWTATVTPSPGASPIIGNTPT